VRLSEFWALADEVFGAAYARTLTAGLVLGSLGDRTADAALADGVPPREVWTALCDDMDVPEGRRWGQQRPQRRGRPA